MKRYTIAVDFDGVLHRYDTPFIAPHVIPDGPVAGAVGWMRAMVEIFDVVVFTTRGRSWRGRRAVRGWMHAHGFPWRGIRVTDRKPAALIYIDDRAFRFTGRDWPTANDVHRALPWHKRESLEHCMDGKPFADVREYGRVYCERCAPSSVGNQHGLQVPVGSHCPLCKRLMDMGDCP